MEKSDKARSTYYEVISNQIWGNKNNYDICLDCQIGNDEIVKIICNYVKNKMKNQEYFSVGILSDTIDLTLNVTDEARKILHYCEEHLIDIQSIRKQLQSVDERTKALTELALNRFVANHDVGCTYILQSDLLPSERNLDIVNHKYIEVIPILLDLKLQLILI